MTAAKLVATTWTPHTAATCGACRAPVVTVPHYTLVVSKNSGKRFGEVLGRVRLCPACFSERFERYR